jgi:hypothetical protein
MQDVVDLHRATVSTNDVGDETVSFATEELTVGFAFENGSRRDARTYEEITWDATMRLPVSEVVGVNDEVTLKSLKGQTVSIRFRVHLAPELGPTAQNVRLQRIIT